MQLVMFLESHRFSCRGVIKLHQSLEASLFFKSGNLVDDPKGTENQVEDLQCDWNVGLQNNGQT